MKVAPDAKTAISAEQRYRVVLQRLSLGRLWKPFYSPRINGLLLINGLPFFCVPVFQVLTRAPLNPFSWLVWSEPRFASKSRHVFQPRIIFITTSLAESDTACFSSLLVAHTYVPVLQAQEAEFEQKLSEKVAELKANALDMEAKVREREVLEARHAEKLQVRACFLFIFCILFATITDFPLDIRQVSGVYVVFNHNFKPMTSFRK